MASIRLKNNILLSDYGLPFFVAELNTSHFGNLSIARDMILEAKNSGCDCVKFQSWSEESLYSKGFYKDNPIAKRMFKKFSLNTEELNELVEYCRQVDIGFASTPYSHAEVDFLVDKCDVPFIKVASMDLNNHPFLEHIGSAGKPVVLSTGMGSIEEVDSAIKVLEDAGCKEICILHCVAVYPPKNETLQLNNILGLRARFPDYPIGYSDHSIGVEMAGAATALGACLIEKHFTLDKYRLGMDNAMAIEPSEMTQLVNSCKNIHGALGSQERVLSKPELEQKIKMRRSVVSTRPIKKGNIISMDDLDAKRPGSGISPVNLKSLIGKTAQRDINGDELILNDDVI
jgi:sialic acid synthase SpsE